MNGNDGYQVGGSHYLDKSIQPWQAMESWMTEDQFRGFLIGNVIKYISRFQGFFGSWRHLHKMHIEVK